MEEFLYNMIPGFVVGGALGGLYTGLQPLIFKKHDVAVPFAQCGYQPKAFEDNNEVASSFLRLLPRRKWNEKCYDEALENCDKLMLLSRNVALNDVEPKHGEKAREYQKEVMESLEEFKNACKVVLSKVRFKTQVKKETKIILGVVLRYVASIEGRIRMNKQTQQAQTYQEFRQLQLDQQQRQKLEKNLGQNYPSRDPHDPQDPQDPPSPSAHLSGRMPQPTQTDMRNDSSFEWHPDLQQSFFARPAQPVKAQPAQQARRMPTMARLPNVSLPSQEQILTSKIVHSPGCSFKQLRPKTRTTNERSNLSSLRSLSGHSME